MGTRRFRATGTVCFGREIAGRWGDLFVMVVRSWNRNSKSPIENTSIGFFYRMLRERSSAFLFLYWIGSALKLRANVPPPYEIIAANLYSVVVFL